MFCKKCGCRIPASAPKCPECGADRPVMEYCAGFWAELNQKTNHNTEEKHLKPGVEVSCETPDTPPQGPNPTDDHEKEVRRKNPKGLRVKRTKSVKSKHLVQIIEAAVILALLAYALILGNTLNKKTNRIGTLEQNLERAEIELQQLREKVQSAEQPETGVFSQMEELPGVGGTGSNPVVQSEDGNTIRSPEGAPFSTTGADTQEEITEPFSPSTTETSEREEGSRMPAEIQEKLQFY